MKLTCNMVYYCSGMKVRGRHQLLKMTIGTFPEEDETNILVMILMLVLPICLILLSFLEWGLFLLYNGNMHPWKAIFVEPQSIDTVSITSNEDSTILESVDIEDVDANHVKLGPVIDDTSGSDNSNTNETPVQKQVLITEEYTKL